jgi:hypothetical protein
MWLTKVMETCSAVRAPACKDSQAGKAGKAVECRQQRHIQLAAHLEDRIPVRIVEIFETQDVRRAVPANALWPRLTARSISATHKFTSHIGVTHCAMNLGE